MPSVRTLAFAVSTALIGGLLAAVSITAATAVGESSGGVFVPVSPYRAAEMTMTGGTTETLQIRGRGAVPATGVSAVVVDIAVTSSTATSSYLAAWPTGAARPLGTMSFNQTSAPRSNTAIVKLGAGTGNGGKIDIYNNSGTSKVYIDVQGYFTDSSNDASTGGFVPINPTRVLNSATGYGTSVSGEIPNGANRDIQVTDGDVIPQGATAVFANIEARDATGPGTIQAGPGDAGIGGYPAVMNFGTSGAYTTGVTIKLNANGKVRLRNGDTGTAVNVKLDIQGYFSGDPTQGGSFTPVVPATSYSSLASSQTQLGAGESREVQIAGKTDIPNGEEVAEGEDAPLAGSVALTINVRNWTANGSVILSNPDVDEVPSTTNVSFIANAGAPASGVSSSAIVELSAEGSALVTNTSTKPVDVVLSSQGWFTFVDTEDEEIESESEDTVTDEAGEEIVTESDLEAEAVSIIDPETNKVAPDVADDSEMPITIAAAGDPSFTSPGKNPYATYSAKTWNACALKPRSSQRDKLVRAFPRVRLNGMVTSKLALRCGPTTRSYGYHHLLKRKSDGGLSHAEVFQKFALGRNWRYFGDWAIYWTVKSPTLVAYRNSDSKWCFRKPIYFKTGQNTYKKKNFYVITGKTGRRLITAYYTGKDANRCSASRGYSIAKASNHR